MTDNSQSTDDTESDGLEAAEEEVNEEPEPGLGPGANEEDSEDEAENGRNDENG